MATWRNKTGMTEHNVSLEEHKNICQTLKFYNITRIKMTGVKLILSGKVSFSCFSVTVYSLQFGDNVWILDIGIVLASMMITWQYSSQISLDRRILQWQSTAVPPSMLGVHSQSLSHRHNNKIMTSYYFWQ